MTIGPRTTFHPGRRLLPPERPPLAWAIYVSRAFALLAPLLGVLIFAWFASLGSDVLLGLGGGLGLATILLAWSLNLIFDR